MKLLLLFFNLLILSLSSAFHQTDYRIEHHKLELISYNHSYSHDGNVTLVPYNATAKAISIAFHLLVDLSEDIEFVLAAYKYAGSQYRLLPYSLTVDFCKERDSNQFGIQDVLEHTNSSLKCPFKKGYYYVDKYRPDETKFPPHLLRGDFKLDVRVLHEKQEAAHVNWYGSVVYPQNPRKV